MGAKSFANRYPIPAIDAVKAAEALRADEIVDWQPGDATRYECALFFKGHEWLGIANFNALVSAPLHTPASMMGAIDHFSPMIPRGSWAGLRPLFVALGWVEGEPFFDPKDSEIEWARRQGRSQASAVGWDPEGSEYHKDAELGRMVRAHLMPILLREQRDEGAG